MSEQVQAVFESAAGSLRLGIEGYQFPDIVDTEWDSNWLVVAGEAALNGRHWRFRDACLTTFEMARLADWLDHIVAGTASQPFCGFTEPNLHFEKRSDRFVRIGFSLEATPPWARRGGDYGFEVPLDDRLIAAASDLRRLLSRYPLRGPSPEA